jgi:hypothetical protein
VVRENGQTKKIRRIDVIVAAMSGNLKAIEECVSVLRQEDLATGQERFRSFSCPNPNFQM